MGNRHKQRVRAALRRGEEPPDPDARHDHFIPRFDGHAELDSEGDLRAAMQRGKLVLPEGVVTRPGDPDYVDCRGLSPEAARAKIEAAERAKNPSIPDDGHAALERLRKELEEAEGF